MHYEVSTLNKERTWLKVVRHDKNEQEIITWSKTLNLSSSELVLKYKRPHWSVTYPLILSNCARLNEDLNWLKDTIKSARCIWRPEMLIKPSDWAGLSFRISPLLAEGFKNYWLDNLKTLDILGEMFELIDLHKPGIGGPKISAQ